jgi:AraC-like DNA-binding protein
MKPTLRKVTPNPGYSFVVRKDVADEMINNWHYHPEFEILYIEKSSGTWLVGDHVGHFQSGNIVLLGSNLPHCYKHDPEFLEKESGGESIGVLFLASVFGKDFLKIPEAAPIKALLDKSAQGLKIEGESEAKCADLLKRMLKMSPGERMIALLSLLNTVAERREYTTLSSAAFTTLIGGDQEKIKAVFDYTLHHFHEKISLDQVASLIHMTRYSFCRFFKRKTKKTYVQFIMEIRIGKACKLLVEDEKNVSEICYACGFNNLSHFHIQFKSITGMKPLEYKKNYVTPEA